MRDSHSGMRHESLLLVCLQLLEGELKLNSFPKYIVIIIISKMHVAKD